MALFDWLLSREQRRTKLIKRIVASVGSTDNVFLVLPELSCDLRLGQNGVRRGRARRGASRARGRAGRELGWDGGPGCIESAAVAG